MFAGALSRKRFIWILPVETSHKKDLCPSLASSGHGGVLVSALLGSKVWQSMRQKDSWDPQRAEDWLEDLNVLIDQCPTEDILKSAQELRKPGSIP